MPAEIPKKIFSIADIVYPARDKYSYHNRVCFDPNKQSITISSGQLSVTFIFSSYNQRFMIDLWISEITYIPRSAIQWLEKIEKIEFTEDRCDIYQSQRLKNAYTGEMVGVDVYTSTVQHLLGKHPTSRNLEELANRYVGKSLFDEVDTKPVKKLYVTQAKRKFDRIIDSLNKTAEYTITPDLTYARWDTEDGFHFEIAVSTPVWS